MPLTYFQTCRLATGPAQRSPQGLHAVAVLCYCGCRLHAGLCYGKPEAAVLAVLLPLLCLSHLGGTRRQNRTMKQTLALAHARSRGCHQQSAASRAGAAPVSRQPALSAFGFGKHTLADRNTMHELLPLAVCVVCCMLLQVTLWGRSCRRCCWLVCVALGVCLLVASTRSLSRMTSGTNLCLSEWT